MIYRLQRLFETGLPYKDFGDCATETSYIGARDFAWEMGRTYDINFETIQVEKVEDHNYSPLKLERMKMIVYIFGFSSCFACILLVLEIKIKPIRVSTSLMRIPKNILSFLKRIQHKYASILKLQNQ